MVLTETEACSHSYSRDHNGWAVQSVYISCLNSIAIEPSFTFEIKLNQFNKNQFNTSLLIFYLFLFYMYERFACHLDVYDVHSW